MACQKNELLNPYDPELCDGDDVRILDKCYPLSESSLWLEEGEMEDEPWPPRIFELVNLTILNIRDANLTNIPPEIRNLTNLVELQLPRCSISEISPEIGNLTNLTSLSLGHNQLTELPEELCNIYSNLNHLGIYNNSICGELPSCLQGVDIGEQNCP